MIKFKKEEEVDRENEIKLDRKKMVIDKLWKAKQKEKGEVSAMV